MRPFSPFCGTVSNAQLLILPESIRMIAPGVVTTQLSFLPPASSSATVVLLSSVSLPATAQPPEPPPTTTKSNVSLTRVPLCLPSRFWRKPPLLRPIWQERFHGANFRGKTGVLLVTKTAKGALWAFPKGAGVDTYASHPQADARVAFSGSLWN